jgi:hypothetical protein
LKRLYRSIEDGIVELDDILRERTAILKSQRESEPKRRWTTHAPNVGSQPPSMPGRSTRLHV